MHMQIKHTQEAETEPNKKDIIKSVKTPLRKSTPTSSSTKPINVKS